MRVVPENHSNKIEITSDGGIVLKYPTINSSLKAKDASESKTESFYNFIIESIDTIYNGDDFSKATDYNNDELKTWLGNLPPEVTRKIHQYFNTMPFLETKIEYVCEKCKKMESMKVEGTSELFF